MASAVNFEITKIFDYARRLLIIALVGSAVGFAPAIAQEDDQQIIPEDAGKAESKTPDIKNGLVIARALCSTCHLIGEPPNSSMPADVPSFPSIASRPGQSLERLSNWLIEPHPPMPNVHLTRKEIRDLSGYILSLRSTQ
jgi:mono/diheme cytochrome c family protein